MTTGQKSSDPHVALVDGSRKLISVDRSEKLLIIINVCNKEKELVSYKVVVHECLGEMLAVMPRYIPPTTLAVCWWKVPKCGLN